MAYDIEEIVLEFQRSDLEDWRAGRRDKWLKGAAPAHVTNQPNYHFGEDFVLAHYEDSGWHGHRFYALGDWEQGSPKLYEGREALKRAFEPGPLAKFRQVRDAYGIADGKGEPDLFLMHPQKGPLFLEVKKGRDKLSPEQLECLAQIRGILGAEVGVVYLVESGRSHMARKYKLEIEKYITSNTFV